MIFYGIYMPTLYFDHNSFYCPFCFLLSSTPVVVLLYFTFMSSFLNSTDEVNHVMPIVTIYFFTLYLFYSSHHVPTNSTDLILLYH